MFPADLLTSDSFLSYVQNRIEECSRIASLTYNELAFVEMCSYSTLLQWGHGSGHAIGQSDYRQYEDTIERINVSLREIDCCMPPLHITQHASDAPKQTDLSRKLQAHCAAVRDVVPALLSLGIPAINDLLSSKYDKLERQIGNLMVLQHKVLIIVPMVRRNFLQSSQYIASVNESVLHLNLRELIFIIGAYENRLLRFRIHNYAVHEDIDK